MTAYIICCNDSTEFVVLDNEGLSKKKLEELSKTDYKNRYMHEYENFGEYCKYHFWHLHKVEYIRGKQIK